MATLIDMTKKVEALLPLAAMLDAGITALEANGHLEGFEAVGFEHVAERFMDTVAFDTDSIDFEYVRRTFPTMARVVAWFTQHPEWPDLLLIDEGDA